MDIDQQMTVDEQTPVALKDTAIYYGLLPGHVECAQGKRGQLVTINEPDIAQKYCVACEKPLLPFLKM
jgi:hypothetical protein